MCVLPAGEIVALPAGSFRPLSLCPAAPGRTFEERSRENGGGFAPIAADDPLLLRKMRPIQFGESCRVTQALRGLPQDEGIRSK
jgi:hypothetical protein